MATKTVIVGDRKLAVEIAGESSGWPILVSAGTPNSRCLYRKWIHDAKSRGIMLIGYDRPGYGGSDPQPGHSVADAAADIRAIASALGLERLALWGFSGGGPYALACAALVPELVVAVATIGSIAPYGAPGLDFFTGMGQENVDDVKLYFEEPETWRRETAKGRLEMLELTPAAILEAWNSLLSPVDSAALTGDYAEYVVDSIKCGLGAGDQGWWDDGAAHLSDWGFELTSIAVPVKVLHGREDRFVPFQHGQWLAENVPNAQAELTVEDGHLTGLVNGIPAVHEWLLRQF